MNTTSTTTGHVCYFAGGGGCYGPVSLRIVTGATDVDRTLYTCTRHGGSEAASAVDDATAMLDELNDIAGWDPMNLDRRDRLHCQRLAHADAATLEAFRSGLYSLILTDPDVLLVTREGFALLNVTYALVAALQGDRATATHYACSVMLASKTHGTLAQLIALCIAYDVDIRAALLDVDFANA